MTRWIVLVGLMAWTGCGDDDGTTDSGTPDANTIDTGGSDASDAGQDVGADSGGGCAEDDNDTFATATDVVFDDAAGVADAISCDGDVDYFAFEGTAGDWVRITTTVDRDAMGAGADTVMTLFDAAEIQIASNDDVLTGLGPFGRDQSQIITRLSATGRYLVRVQEFNDVGDPGWTYTLRAVTASSSEPDLAEDGETGDDAGSATAAQLVTMDTPVGVSADFGYVFGTFRDADDVDVFSFEVDTSAPSVVGGAYVTPHGTDGSGSTTAAGEVWITDADGTTILARNDPATGLLRVQPTLATGSYLLWVSHPGGAVGANDFYVLGVVRDLMENPRETNEAGNGTLAGAETLELADTPVAGLRRGIFLSLLPPDDVDYWSFEIVAGEEIGNVGCSGTWDGSGIRGFTLEIRDDTDAVLATAVEDDALPAQLGLVGAAETGIDAPGTYYLRLTKTSQDPEVSGNFVRCAVIAMTP